MCVCVCVFCMCVSQGVRWIERSASNLTSLTHTVLVWQHLLKKQVTRSHNTHRLLQDCCDLVLAWCDLLTSLLLGHCLFLHHLLPTLHGILRVCITCYARLRTCTARQEFSMPVCNASVRACMWALFCRPSHNCVLDLILARTLTDRPLMATIVMFASVVRSSRFTSSCVCCVRVCVCVLCAHTCASVRTNVHACVCVYVLACMGHCTDRRRRSEEVYVRACTVPAARALLLLTHT